LMEAMLSFQGLIACQDLGACGIACATSEMAAAGGTGFDVDLEAVPQRESGMEAFEILLSESQERFMLVIEPGLVDTARAHFRSHGVHAAACGTVTDSGRLRVIHGGEVVVDLPADLIADGTPTQRWAAATLPAPQPYGSFRPPDDLGTVLLDLLATPGIADLSWLYDRYDQTVGNRTVRGPGQGEAAVQRLPGSTRGYAISLVGDGARCASDPYSGTRSLLGEALRNLACVGAEAIAVTDGLNTGSPSDPVEFARLEQVIRGLGDGLRTLGLPVTGGNCSLYNESPAGAIPPTPMIGMVGVVADVRRIPSPRMAEGQALILLGSPPDGPAHSAYGALMAGPGDPAPTVDLDADMRLARLLREQIARIGAAKDAGAGGRAVALAKMCIRSGVGAAVEGEWNDWALFGEGSGMAWIAVDPVDAEALLAVAGDRGVPATMAGTVGGDRLVFGDAVDLPLAGLTRAWRRS